METPGDANRVEQLVWTDVVHVDRGSPPIRGQANDQRVGELIEKIAADFLRFVCAQTNNHNISTMARHRLLQFRSLRVCDNFHARPELRDSLHDLSEHPDTDPCQKHADVVHRPTRGFVDPDQPAKSRPGKWTEGTK